MSELSLNVYGNRTTNPVDLDELLVQPSCNLGGNCGSNGRNGWIIVNSVERMDMKYL
jgi:hypothetical protein